jgi:hypothetical protein
MDARIACSNLTIGCVNRVFALIWHLQCMGVTRASTLIFRASVGVLARRGIQALALVAVLAHNSTCNTHIIQGSNIALAEVLVAATEAVFRLARAETALRAHIPLLRDAVYCAHRQLPRGKLPRSEWLSAAASRGTVVFRVHILVVVSYRRQKFLRPLRGAWMIRILGAEETV